MLCADGDQCVDQREYGDVDAERGGDVRGCGQTVLCRQQRSGAGCGGQRCSHGFANQLVTNDTPPVITGNFAGAVMERGALNPGQTEIATGTLVLAGGTFTEQTGTGGMYGSFVLEVNEANSTWTYTLNNDNDDTNALAADMSVTETFPVQSSGNTPAQVVITITGANDAPTADAGVAQTVTAGEMVMLDGSGSDDPDTGDLLSYEWVQTGGESVTLSSTAVATPTFMAPDVMAVTTLTFTLVVNDGSVDSAADTVTITVTDDDAVVGDIVLSPASLTVSETGSASYDVSLSVAPSGPVNVAIAGGAGSDGLTFDPAILTFDVGNSDVAQAVTVMAEAGTLPADSSSLTLSILHTASGGGYDDVEGSLSLTVLEQPGLVRNFTATPARRRVVLSWEAPENAVATAVTGYELQRRARSSTQFVALETLSFGDTTTQFVLPPRNSATSFEFRIRALAAGVVGEWLSADSPGALLSETLLEIAEGGTATYTVVLQTTPTATVTVVISSNDDDVTATGLTFTVTNSNIPQEVTVTAAQDEDAFDDVGISLNHDFQGGGYGSVSARVDVNVLDDDIAQLSVVADTVTEGETATVSVSLDRAVGERFTVNFATGGGSATVVDDYTASSGTLTFAGTTGEVQTFTVATAQDNIAEPAETVQVSLSGVTPSDLPIDIAGVTNVDAVTITDADPTVEITGDFAGEVTERGALNPDQAETSTGVLTLQGSDFAGQTGTGGTYGSFDLEATGAWTYRLDNNNSATNALAAGEEMTDVFTAVSEADATVSQAVTITITGANDAPTAVIDEAPMLVVVAGSSVTLNSSGSADPDTGGSIDSYLWSVASDGIPSLVPDTLNEETLTFMAPEVETEQTYIIDLMVGDGTALSAPAMVTVTVQPRARISDIVFSSTGPYMVDGEIEVTVTFTEVVTVEIGMTTPRLSLTVGTVTRDAEYTATAPAETAVFSYTVVADDNDNDGVEVVANTLTAGEGTIRDGAGNDAALAHVAITAVAAQRVDTVSPDLLSVAVNGDVVTLTYDEALNEEEPVPLVGAYTLPSHVALTVTNVSINSDTVTLTLSGMVVFGDMVTLSYAAGINPVQDVAGNDAANLTGETVTNDTPVVITGIFTGEVTERGALNPEELETVANALALTSGGTFVPQMDIVGTYGSFGLEADGAWTYTLDNDDPDTNALAAGEEMTDVFTAVSDSDPDVQSDVTITITGANDAPVADAGVAQTMIAGDTVTLSGSGSDPDTGDSIETYMWMQMGEPNVTLTDANAAIATFMAPNVGAVTTLTFTLVVGDGAADSLPATVTVTVSPDIAPVFDDAVVIDQVYTVGVGIIPLELPEATGGNPPLIYSLDTTPALPQGLTFTPGTRTIAGTPTAMMVQTTYTLTATDSDGINRDTATFEFALRINAVATVTDVALTSDANEDGLAGDDDTYAIGDVIEATVTFSEEVTVSGMPQLALTVGGQTRQALYTGDGSASMTQVFSYTVVAGDTDVDGVSIDTNALAVPLGSSIQDADDIDAVIAHAAVSDDLAHRVDAVIPVLLSVAVNGDVVTLTYNEALDENSVPLEGAYRLTRMSGAAPSVTGVLISGGTVMLMLSEAVMSEYVVTLAYTAGSNPVQDVVGNDADSFANQPVVNDTPAVITGNFVGEVTERGADTPTQAETAEGMLSAAGGFVAQDGTTDRASGMGIYGTFVLATTGAWTYTLDNDLSVTNALAAAATVTEVFTVVSATNETVSQAVTITITGANDAPTAEAGDAQLVPQRAMERLDGTDSFDPDTGDTLTYSWAQTSTPVVDLIDDVTLATATFTFTTPDVSADTTLTFTLTVTDSGGAISTDTVTITVETGNFASAITGPITGTVTEDAQMDTATGALMVSDPDGGEPTFQAQSTTGTYGTFVLTTAVATSTWTYTLDNDDPDTNALAAGVSVIETFRVQASDNTPALVMITVNGANDAPVADAGVAQTVIAGDTVMLDGSGSDPDTGDLLSYEWTQIEGPNVNLTDADAAATTFMAPGVTTVTTLTFTLVVGDGTADSLPSTVTVTVSPDTAPVFDETIDNQNYTVGVGIDELALPTASGGNGALIYTLTPALPNGLEFDDQALEISGRPELAQAATEYTYTVSDSDFNVDALDMDMITFMITINTNPITGVAQGSVTEDDLTANTATGELTLQGSGFRVQTTATATVRAEGLGTYGRFGLTAAGEWTYTLDNADPDTNALAAGEEVTDMFTAVSASDGGVLRDVIITITGANDAPVADAGAGQLVLELTDVMLFGSGSDPDMGDVIESYTWTQIGDGSDTVTLDDATTATLTFEALDVDTATELTFTLVVSDGEADSLPDTVTVTVRDTPVGGDLIILGDIAGRVTEDAAVTTATGTLRVSDGVGTFTAQDGTTDRAGGLGTYGRFELATTGAWTYTLDNNDPDTDALAAGVSVPDTFTAVLSSGSTQTVTITITGSNDAPVADAGAGQLVLELTDVTLSGRGSFDPDTGDVIESYIWTQIGDGSDTVSLTGDETATLTFTAPAVDTVTTLTFTLVVRDGEAVSLPSTVTVTVGPDSSPDFGTPVAIDQFYAMGVGITPLQLPEATGGNPPLIYSLDTTPALPEGLIFTSDTRQITGTPTEIRAQETYTLTVTDSDEIDPDTDAFTFTLEVGGAAPSVTGIALTSDANADGLDGNDNTYAIGDEIEATVTFSEDVTVSGTPQLMLTVGVTLRTMTYEIGSAPTSNLVFSYTVVAGDLDSDGVSISANALTVPTGSTIRDSDNFDATLDGHAGVDDADAHRVDGIVPTVTGIEFSTSGPHVLGATIEVEVTFSETVTVSGTPQLSLMVGVNTRQAAYVSNSGAMTELFRYTVLAGDNDDNGVSIIENALGLNGGTIRDGAGNNAVLNHNAIAADPQQQVDTVIPAINTIEFSTTGPYVLGDAIEVEVTFGEEVTVNTGGGVPQLPLTLGGSTAQAAYVSNPDAMTAVFRYTVMAGDNDDDGVSIVGNTLELNGGTISDSAGNNADLNHNTIAADPQQRVDTVIPVINTIEFITVGPYVLNNAIEVTVTFSEAVTVNTVGGVPQLPLTLGSSTVQAAYVSNPDATTVVFSYTVMAGDNDDDGVEVAINTLTADGGTIRDGAGNDADLNHNAIAADTQQRVDAMISVINTIEFRTTGPYVLDDVIEVEVTFSEEVTVIGVPQLPLTLGGSTVQAAYVSNPDATTVVFSYTVMTGDNDADGVSIVEDTLELNSGTIRDGAGNDADLNHDAIAANTQQQVDTVIPAINEIAFSTTGPYVLGDAIEVTVTFSEEVTVSGSAQLPLILGSSTVQAAYVSNPDATTTAVFRYTVVANDNDDDGVVVTANTLTAGGGTISDGAGNNAVLDHAAIGVDTQQRVDTAIPVINTIEFSTAGPYVLNNAIEVTVTFSEAVTVNTVGGVPQLPLILGSSTVQAAYVSNPGAVTTAVFSYTVVAGDNDDDGVSIVEDTLGLNGGTIRDGAGNNADLNHNAIDADPQQRVDAVISVINNIEFITTGPYVLNDAIEVAVTFSEEVTVSGVPQLPLILDSSTVQAIYVNNPGAVTTAVFSYTVAAGDNDADGVSIVEDALGLNGGTIRDGAGNNADLNHDPIAADTQQRVDTVIPIINTIEFRTTGPYVRNDAIEVEVTFSEAVTVNTVGGVPQLPLILGSSTVQAAYVSNPGAVTTAVFSYTVATGDNDDDGVSIVEDTLGLNGGTISDGAGNNAELDHDAIAADTQQRVDTVIPIINEIAFSTTGPYVLGDAIEVAVTFSEAVTVSASAQLPLILGSSTVQAAYASNPGEVTTAVFRYTVLAGDNDDDGVEVALNTLTAGGGTISDGAGNNADLNHDAIAANTQQRVDTVIPIINEIAFSTTGPYVLGDAIEVEVTFSEEVTVNTVGGVPQLPLTLGSSIVQAAYVSNPGAVTTAVFRYTVAANDNDDDGVVVAADALTASGGTIRDGADNNAVLAHVAIGVDAQQRVDTVIPVINTIGFSTTGPYVLGDAIEVEVTFSEEVTVSALAQLPLILGSSTVQAAYVSNPGAVTTAVFRYTVVAGDNDDNGVEVTANTLTAGGGTISDGAGNNAVLAHAGIGVDVQQRVDTVIPVINTIRFSTTGPYVLDDAIDVTVTFSEDVTVIGVPQLPLTVDRSTLPTMATYESGSGTRNLVFSYTVLEGDNDDNGVSIAENTLELNGGTIRDGAGNNAELNHDAIVVDPQQLVDAVIPIINTIEFSTTGPYVLNDAIEVTVTFSEEVTVSASAQLPLRLGSSTRQAAYVSNPGAVTTAVFRYTVVDGDNDNDGVEVEANTLTAGGGTIRDGADNDAVLDHNAIDADAQQRVDTMIPAINTIEFSTTGPYALDDAIEVVVTFSEAVTVNTAGGVPRLPLTLDGSTRQAAYVNNLGAVTTAVFSYTVVAGDNDNDGVSIVENALELNGGTIRDGVGNNAVLNHDAIDADTQQRVDAVIPVIDTIAFSTTGPYVRGDAIEVTVTFSEDVTVDTDGGVPQLVLAVDRSTPPTTATYESGSGTSNLVFSYMVLAGDNDDDGVSIGANTLELNGGTIRDSAGNNVVPDHDVIVADTQQLVDTMIPAINTIEFSTTGPYARGDTIEVVVTFSEAVTVNTVGGVPQLVLTVDRAISLTAAIYESGSGTRNLVFSYTVLADDNDDDGVSIIENALELNGGTIRDGAGNNAVPDHDVIVADTQQRVDNDAPTLSDNIGVDAAVVDATILTLTYDEVLDDSLAPAPGDYRVTREFGAAPRVRSVSISGQTVTLTLSDAVEFEEAVTLTYTVTVGSNPVQDVAGNDAAEFDNRMVTNNTPEPDLTPTFGTQTIADQFYCVGVDIGDVILPEAIGGNGNLEYAINPNPALPQGLTFTPGILTRTLSGTPTALLRNRMEYRYTATDDDIGSNSPPDTSTLTFTIAVRERFVFNFDGSAQVPPVVVNEQNGTATLMMSVASSPMVTIGGYSLSAFQFEVEGATSRSLTVDPAMVMPNEDVEVRFSGISTLTATNRVIEVRASAMVNNETIESGFVAALINPALNEALNLPPPTNSLADELVVMEPLTIMPGPYALAQGSTDTAIIQRTALVPEAPAGYTDAGTGIFDFSIGGITACGSSVGVRIRLLADAPDGARLFKYDGGSDGEERWSQFTSMGADNYYDAVLTSAEDTCPAPDEPKGNRPGQPGQWRDARSGTQPGARCLLVEISDGSLNDADGSANGIVFDPSGLFIRVGDGGSSGGGGGAMHWLWLLLIATGLLALRRPPSFSRKREPSQ